MTWVSLIYFLCFRCLSEYPKKGSNDFVRRIKKGDQQLVQNYRPVALLSELFKVLKNK